MRRICKYCKLYKRAYVGPFTRLCCTKTPGYNYQTKPEDTCDDFIRKSPKYSFNGTFFQERNYFRVSKNYVTIRCVESFDDFDSIPSSTMLCGISFKAKSAYEYLSYAVLRSHIKYRNIFVCANKPIESMSEHEQLSWRLHTIELKKRFYSNQKIYADKDEFEFIKDCDKQIKRLELQKVVVENLRKRTMNLQEGHTSFREGISAMLMNTNENNHLQVEIILEPEESMGLSSLELPRIVEMFQLPTDGEIYYKMFGEDKFTNLDDFPGDLEEIYRGLLENY